LPRQPQAGAAAGNTTTQVRYSSSYALHPGDAGADVHNIILQDIAGLIPAPKLPQAA
jgi:hypothetical protein